MPHRLCLSQHSRRIKASGTQFAMHGAVCCCSSVLAIHSLTMIINVVTSCIQNVRYPLTKLTALELLLDFGALISAFINSSHSLHRCLC